MLHFSQTLFGENTKGLSETISLSSQCRGKVVYTPPSPRHHLWDHIEYFVANLSSGRRASTNLAR
ncbi:hypothetical protein H5410_050063 [Solanum commersonii]|uniref:Uncharacterized protein n=1 Tax=Solanum commersonii TaxID=4109 RepID=A0A9J5WWI2_SOLCO|nr:hypothetical protein H5410_050063 [Solanum commersonii]